MNDRSHALHYISKAIERPLMIMPEKLAVIASVLEGRLGLDATGLQHLVDEKMLAYVNKPAADRFTGDTQTAEGQTLTSRRSVKPYRVANGVAIIGVIGSLVNRGAWIGSYSGMTSYEGLSHQLKSAAADSSITSILLDIDSPGGEAIGAFETGSLVREINAKTKPVNAFVNGLCCSAAFAIGAGAGRIEASATSLLGSIGVVMMHVDQSARLHNMGVKPTFIFAGAHKVDGNPFEPLSNAVRADLQSEVDKFYDLFVHHVATSRKGVGLTAKAVREQEARTFIGSDAVDRKLADAIGTFETTLAGMHRRSKTRTMKMDEQNLITQAQHETLLASAVTAARLEAATATTASLTTDHTNALNAAVATARTEGATAERERISAVLALPEAQGREGAAMHLAMTTTMTADQAKPVLAGLPTGHAAKQVAGNGVGLVVDKTVQQTAAAAAGGWDKSLQRAGATLPEKKSA
jgi:signal peptide peptidase SppA